MFKRNQNNKAFYPSSSPTQWRYCTLVVMITAWFRDQAKKTSIPKKGKEESGLLFSL